jgi:hypothetical protein
MTMILHPHASYHNLAQSQMVKKNGLSNESWINRIVDKGKQYLVHWHGWGPEEDCWLPSHELSKMEAFK